MKEYGFNFKSNAGYEPAMVDDVKERGFDYVLEAGQTTRENFNFTISDDVSKITLKATLTYIFFVTPPPEAKERMQQSIIRRIQTAKSQKEKDEILNVEIPARMNSMNIMESTYPPVVMETAEKEITLNDL